MGSDDSIHVSFFFEPAYSPFLVTQLFYSIRPFLSNVVAEEPRGDEFFDGLHMCSAGEVDMALYFATFSDLDGQSTGLVRNDASEFHVFYI